MSELPLLDSYSAEASAINVPMVKLVSQAELATTWIDHEDMFSDALAYSWQEGDTLEHLSKRIAQSQAWVVDVIQGDRILAAAVTEIIQTKNGPYMNIWVCGGTRLDQWYQELLEFVENWALTMGAKGVMLGGRKGWQRQLKSLGYEVESVILKKGLSHELRR